LRRISKLSRQSSKRIIATEILRPDARSLAPAHPRERGVRLRIALASAAGAAIALNVAGCALFHHSETPQQQFSEALGRGDSVQASYIWNNMSAQDRAKFERGEGISPRADPSTIAAQIEQQQEEGQGDDDADPPSLVEIPGDDGAAQ
jgi:hypothetical protein